MRTTKTNRPRGKTIQEIQLLKAFRRLPTADRRRVVLATLKLYEFAQAGKAASHVGS